MVDVKRERVAAWTRLLQEESDPRQRLRSALASSAAAVAAGAPPPDNGVLVHRFVRVSRDAQVARDECSRARAELSSIVDVLQQHPDPIAEALVRQWATCLDSVLALADRACLLVAQRANRVGAA